MTCIFYDAPYAIETLLNQTPDFASGFYRARHPLERVEFDMWFDALAMRCRRRSNAAPPPPIHSPPVRASLLRPHAA
jgi:hypothetical protein